MYPKSFPKSHFLSFDSLFIIPSGLSEGRYSVEYFKEREKSLNSFFDYLKKWPYDDPVKFEDLMNNFDEYSDVSSFFYENTHPAWNNLILMLAMLGIFEITWESPFDIEYECVSGTIKELYLEAYDNNQLLKFPFGKLSGYHYLLWGDMFLVFRILLSLRSKKN